MVRRLVIALCAVGLVMSAATAVVGQAAPVDRTQAVRDAIARGVAWLYSQQKPDGSWEAGPAPWNNAQPPSHSSPEGGQYGGYTAMATYALLAAGESVQDPRVQKALNWLAEADMRGVYALGLRGQVWQYLPQSGRRQQLANREKVIMMEAAAQKQGLPIFGKYHYMINSKNSYDNSVSQYGVLAMWGAALAGSEVPSGFWRTIEAAWLKDQHADGGWSYQPSQPTTFTMTSAGVATLFITQDYLHLGQGIKCEGNIGNPALERGLKWLNDNFDQVTRRQPYYALYGVERIGVASGRKYFGTTDWYEFGVDYLLPKQNKQGGQWGTLPNTAFALVFLARGSAPVAINKLQYELEGLKAKQESHWTQRPRDTANVVHWMGTQIERPLNWQIINLQVAAAAMHDAPILYIAGNQRLSFSAEDQAKLKLFVEQGGLIVGNADCGDRNFTASFRDLGKKLFDTEFRELPDNHPIYTIHFKRDALRKKPRWQGLSNGARELMVLIGDDAARSWQGQMYGGNEGDFQMMLNLFKYAVDSEGMQARGKTHIVLPDPKATPRQTIKVARGIYPGNWNPEPGGWERLKAVMLNQNSVGLEVTAVKLGSEPIPADVKVLHLTGANAMELDDSAREAIRGFVAGGGTLVIDAAGGNGQFVTSADQLITSLWPDQAKQLDQPLKGDHGIYAAAGKKMAEFNYRGGVRAAAGSKQPNLRGIEVDGRAVVLYSREDISVGLVGMPVAGIVGYDPATATELMKNILLYVSARK